MIGRQLGPYQIVAKLGEGGMGEVYRATDTQLKRQVALKALPPEVSDDPERLARFQREAEVLASLNHPHIAQIYGVERSTNIFALVMELVEGEDLSERIARGAIPLAEALPIATQIAEALAAAHEQGIIHRDLKPGNIKVRDDGTVKVLDFGLAKAIERAGDAGGAGRTLAGALARPAMTQSPTITSPALMTGVGVLLGTAAYMSPEQAKGRPVDRRADLWAFGCVLFEMLTGTRAFPGDGVTDTIVSVLSKDPQWTLLPAGTPPTVRTLLRRCLERDATKRLDSALVARLDLEQVPDVTTPSQASRRRGPSAGLLAGAFLAGLALAAAATRFAPHAEPPRPVMRFSIRPPQGYGWSAASPPALTLDGRRLAMVAVDANNQTSLWMRSLDASASVAIAGTDGASLPFWSPDGTDIGFFADGKLKTIPITGGTPQTLAGVSVPGRAAWARDGTIIFRPGIRGPLARIGAHGGTPSPITAVGENGRERLHTGPSILSDGERFIFGVIRNPGPNLLAVGDLSGATDARRIVVPNLSPQSFDAAVRNGYVLYAAGRSVMAQRLDTNRLVVSGEAVPVADDVAPSTGQFVGSFSVSDDVLVYEPGDVGITSVVMLDHAGAVQRLVATSTPDLQYGYPALSPDGKRVAISINGDIWTLDLERGQRMRLTFDNKDANVDPVWSADGKQIVFASHPDGAGDTFKLVASSGSAPARELPVRSDSGFARVHAWSPDGRYIAYVLRSNKTGLDLWLLDVTAQAATAQPLVVRDGNQQSVRFSPDGKWIVYESDETGRPEIFIQLLSGDAPRRQVSIDGGNYPRWSHDGQALFWTALDGKMMTTTVRRVPDLETSVPVPLFDSRLLRGGGGHYDVRPDGGFIMQTLEERPADEVHVIMNWPTLLKH